MSPKEYNQIIREHFDISDSKTRKCIIALEADEQNQMLTALSGALYDKIVQKVDEIDFGTIPRSRGDITKVEGFENSVECLNIMRSLVMEYKENPEIVDNVLAAIENIKNRKAIFMKAYSLNIEFPMVLYNLITMAIEQCVSFLISVTIQYIKDPASQSLAAALDKVAYSNTRDNLLYEQIASFNKTCSNGDMDIMLKDIMKNGSKVAEDASVIINMGKDSSIELGDEKPKSPFQCDDKEKCPEPMKLTDKYAMVMHGCGSACEEEPVEIQESPLAIIGIGAAAISLGVQAVRIVIKLAIPVMRNITYFIINSRVKFSDCLAVQAQFIEANAYKLKYSTSSELDDDKKEKVVQRQLKIAEKLKNFSNKIAIDSKKARKEAERMAGEESKKYKVDDLNDLPPDIADKGTLFAI